MRCYGRVGTATWTQETYETGSRDARRRAAELRRLGYRVAVTGIGPQVTGVGRVAMTLVTVRHGAEQIPPWPTEVVRF